MAEKEANSILRVEDVMVREVIKIEGNVTIKEAAKLMNKHEIGCLIAVEKGKISGILTERDLLKRVVAKAKDASKLRVRDVMTSPLIVTEPTMDLSEAVRLMFQMKIKKLPVMENKRLMGLLSLTDIARFQPQMMGLIKQIVANLNTPKHMLKVVGRYVI
jgi:CBS domain-containing protein